MIPQRRYYDQTPRYVVLKLVALVLTTSALLWTTIALVAWWAWKLL